MLAGGIGTHGLQGYSSLPDWVEPGREPDPRLRDEEGTAASSSSRYDTSAPAGEKLDQAMRSAPASGGKANGTGEPVAAKTLDDWLAEEEEEESEETEEETEEETDDEEDEEDDEEEEDDSGDEGERDKLVKS